MWLSAAPFTEPQAALAEVATSRNGRPGPVRGPRVPAGAPRPALRHRPRRWLPVRPSRPHCRQGEVGQGSRSVSEVDPPPMSSGHAPGASASSLDTLSQGGLALCVWRAVCHLSTTRGPFSEEGVMGGCWWPRHIWLSLAVAPGRVGAAQVTGLRSGHRGSGPVFSRVLRTEAWSGGSALSKKRLISGLQTERPVASGWVTP